MDFYVEEEEGRKQLLRKLERERTENSVRVREGERQRERKEREMQKKERNFDGEREAFTGSEACLLSISMSICYLPFLSHLHGGDQVHACTFLEN